MLVVSLIFLEITERLVAMLQPQQLAQAAQAAQRLTAVLFLGRMSAAQVAQAELLLLVLLV